MPTSSSMHTIYPPPKSPSTTLPPHNGTILPHYTIRRNPPIVQVSSLPVNFAICNPSRRIPKALNWAGTRKTQRNRTVVGVSNFLFPTTEHFCHAPFALLETFLLLPYIIHPLSGPRLGGSCTYSLFCQFFRLLLRISRWTVGKHEVKTKNDTKYNPLF